MRRFLITIVTLSVCALAILGIAKALSFAKQVIGIPREAYASDWTGVFIIEHIRTTGDWPTGWQDLRDEFDRLAVPEHYAWTFEELQSIVHVDWDVAISDIQDSDGPLDHVRLTSGRQVSYGGDPDRLIYDFIQTGEDPNQIRERIGAHSRKTDGVTIACTEVGHARLYKWTVKLPDSVMRVVLSLRSTGGFIIKQLDDFMTYLAENGVSLTELSRQESFAVTRQWTSVFATQSDSLHETRGLKAIDKWLSATNVDLILLFLSARITAFPISDNSRPCAAHRYTGPIIDLSAYNELEFAVFPESYEWTLIHTHEDHAFGGPYFIRNEAGD